ncbi:hypothetical protein ILYODFUR_005675 [Ilyodon furcidens]|uniref:Uncharacterized protein n=1 Tax=Ilyodon furcidens TaxID=33524 RepID=A0ABV0SVX2_9TELE
MVQAVSVSEVMYGLCSRIGCFQPAYVPSHDASSSSSSSTSSSVLFAGLQMGLWRSAAGPKHQGRNHQGRNLKTQRRLSPAVV